MFEKLIFLSYRRADTRPVALALKLELERRLSNTVVFLDVSSIEPGNDFPSTLLIALERADLVVALIGPLWAPNRIEDPKDWVRRELDESFRLGLPVLPILVDSAVMPRREQLPQSLHQLASVQAAKLDQELWLASVDSVTRHIQKTLGREVCGVKTPWPRPNPVKVRTPLTTREILESVAKDGTLRNWRTEIEPTRFDEEPFAEHLVIRVQFQKHSQAVKFTLDLAELAREMNHHPIIEITFRIVTVKVRTYDAGHRITHFDLVMADRIDKLLSGLPGMHVL